MTRKSVAEIEPLEDVVRILLVDDHSVVRAGLRMLIDSQAGIRVVGEASNPAEALEAAAREKPEIILLDLDLGGSSGVDLIPELLQASAESRVLVLTGVRDPDQHQRAVRVGAMGVLVKESTSDFLLKAIDRVHAGEIWLDRSMLSTLISEMQRANQPRKPDPDEARIARLSDREREVIALVGEGLKNKQIAARLFISETTVRHHLSSIFEKLGVADRLELLIYSYQKGLVKMRR